MSVDLAVGDVIQYSSGGSVHEGTIIELGRYSHVRVDSTPITIPPGWIIGKVTVASGEIEPQQEDR